MSRTYEILCHDCKVSLWIGQGSGEKAYIYGTEQHKKQLRDFLFGHQNHRLEFGDDEAFSLLDYKSLDEEDEASKLLSGEIKVGESFIWEPNDPKAREHVIVTCIISPHDDERQIETENSKGERYWNGESRFREACVRT